MRCIVPLVVPLIVVAALPGCAHERPPIVGVAHIGLKTSDLAAQTSLMLLTDDIQLRKGSDYRLVFEREWRLPEDTDSRTLLADVLGFLVDALRIALSEDLPPARRLIVYKTSEAIQELATATA